MLRVLPGKDVRGFSIQTLLNLPKVDAMTADNFNKAVALAELKEFVSKFGTERQKELIQGTDPKE